MNIYNDAIILIHHRRHLNGGEHNAYDDEIEKALERAKKVEMENFTIQELKELLKGLNVKKGNKEYLIINDTLQYYEDDEELEEMK